MLDVGAWTFWVGGPCVPVPPLQALGGCLGCDRVAMVTAEAPSQAPPTDQAPNAKLIY